MPRAELMALVIPAENINTAGVDELRVDAQYLLTSIAKPARAKRGINGDLWLRLFDACDSGPNEIAPSVERGGERCEQVYQGEGDQDDPHCCQFHATHRT